MSLPDLSNSMYVAYLRHVQATREEREWRNPDVLVGRLLPLAERVRIACLRKERLQQLRNEPFYYYLLARTKYYDMVFTDALSQGKRLVIGVGAGTDTRPHRFKRLLDRFDARVIECDQRASSLAKQRLARRFGSNDRVSYLPVDLNDVDWSHFKRVLGDHDRRTALVLMEGVSPYVEATALRRFLQMLGASLAVGSEVAYDFKRAGIKDTFGQSERTLEPFRLPSEEAGNVEFHRGLGLGVESCVLSADLWSRVFPGMTSPITAPFDEDGLLRLRVLGEAHRSASS